MLTLHAADLLTLLFSLLLFTFAISFVPSFNCFVAIFPLFWNKRVEIIWYCHLQKDKTENRFETKFFFVFFVSLFHIFRWLIRLKEFGTWNTENLLCRRDKIEYLTFILILEFVPFIALANDDDYDTKCRIVEQSNVSMCQLAWAENNTLAINSMGILKWRRWIFFNFKELMKERTRM